MSNNVHRLMYDRKQAELFRQFDRARYCVGALLAHKLTPGPCGSAPALLQGQLFTTIIQTAHGMFGIQQQIVPLCNFRYAYGQHRCARCVTCTQHYSVISL
ncbi:hypothetical protein ABBQ38_007455 [Trebouxia sp. C0009 RCD-2024]